MTSGAAASFILLAFAIHLLLFLPVHGMAIDILDSTHLAPMQANFCNDSGLAEAAGLLKTLSGQFLGYPCSADFFHCRWQSDGFRTYKKICKEGLVFDTLGTQNCNFDFNIKGCGIISGGPDKCKPNEFHCPLSEKCLPMSQRCDGKYDCVLEEDEQNCPMCSPDEFPCIVSEQCINSTLRCNGIRECGDGTDEAFCEGCGQGFFHCLKSRQCVPAAQRCDATPQCSQGDDEFLCKSSHDRNFVCENHRDQIAITKLCDGFVDCPDGSDERYCVPVDPSPPYVPTNPPAPVPMATVTQPAPFVPTRPLPVTLPTPRTTTVEENESDEFEALPVSPLLPIMRFTPRPMNQPFRPLAPALPVVLPPQEPSTTLRSIVKPFNVPRVATLPPVMTMPPTVPTTTLPTTTPEPSTAPPTTTPMPVPMTEITTVQGPITEESSVLRNLRTHLQAGGNVSTSELLQKLNFLLKPNNLLIETASPMPAVAEARNIRITPRPYSRKWRPSLSSNVKSRTIRMLRITTTTTPSTTPAPPSTTAAPTLPTVPAVQLFRTPETPLKVRLPTSMHQRKTKMAPKITAVEVFEDSPLTSEVPKTKTKATTRASPMSGLLNQDEVYFTYDEQP